jgi:two-component system, LytTR family, sensor kinase
VCNVLVPLGVDFWGNKKPFIAWLILLFVIPWVSAAFFSVFSLAVSWFFDYFLLTAYLIAVPSSILGVVAGSLKRSAAVKKEVEKLEKHNVKTELELLKAKINPHFLFNTINNIDGLIAKEPAFASKYLNQLCDLLRFMVYEANSDKIALVDEIDYIKKYVELQRIRSANPNFVNLSISGEILEQKIPPMLFISIVENAFKYVVGKSKDKAIDMIFDISSSAVEFTCRNSYSRDAAANSEKGGQGISLMTQRLDLLYGKRYKIDTKINQEEMYYETRLTIPLDVN